MDELLSVEEAAHLLKCSPRTLRSKRYRELHGIHAVRLCKKLYFDATDVHTAIDANKEAFNLEKGE
jgi:hypothetical protein